MKKFNFILKADSNDGPNIFSKMKKDIAEQFIVPEKSNQENNIKNTDRVSQVDDVSQMNDVVPANEVNRAFDNLNLNQEDVKNAVEENRDIDGGINISNNDVNINNDDELASNSNQEIQSLSSEAKDEIINEILQDKELGDLIDKTIENAEDGKLYADMDKITDDLIKDLKQVEGNEKEAYKNLIKELFSEGNNTIEKAELLEKLQVSFEVADTLQEEKEISNLIQKIEKSDEPEIKIDKEVAKALEYEAVELSNISQINNIEIDANNLSMSGNIDLNNANINTSKEITESDIQDADIAKRRENMVLKIVDKIESERIQKEKKERLEAMDEGLFALSGNIGQNLDFFKEYENYTLEQKIEKRDLLIKELAIESEKLENSESKYKALDEFLKKIESGESKKGARRDLKKILPREKYNELRKLEKEGDTDEIKKERSFYQKECGRHKDNINEKLGRIACLDKMIELQTSEEKSNDSKDKSSTDINNVNQLNENNEERINFIKDQSQKTEAKMDEKDKDLKLSALKDLDDAKRNGDEIPSEILEKVYKVFDIQNNPERKEAIDEFAREKPIEISQNRTIEASQEISQDTRPVEASQEINNNKNSDYSASINVVMATKIQGVPSNPYAKESGESRAFETGLSSFNSPELLNMNRHLLPALQKIEEAQKIPKVANISEGKETFVERGQNSRPQGGVSRS